MTTHWPSRITAFSLWALAALSVAYWVLKFVGSAEAPITAGAITIESPVIAAADLVRVLGPATAAPLAQAAAPVAPVAPVVRMQLLGVVSGRNKNTGVALISVEGQPARPYRVGSAIDGAYRLTRVAARSATLTPTKEGADAITLELASTAADLAPRQTAQTGPANPALAVQPRPGAASNSATEPAKD